MMAPSASAKNNSYAIATITFDPRLVTASSQINVGKGAQFSFNEIKRYSTVTYQNSFVDSTAIASGAVNLGDCVEIFGFSEKDETWYIMSGEFEVEWIDTKNASVHKEVLKLGQVWHNPPLLPHRLICIKAGTVIEVSTPDSVEDNYRVLPGDSQK